jgi:serine phosphatase RsbU (regulator of sigma subunit)
MAPARESTQVTIDSTVQQHELQCMEVWSGSKHVENNVQAPGFSAWIYSKPYQESKSGGDVYFLSLCMGGVLSRLLLGDVAGHGADASATSLKLRQSIRKFINYKNQQRLVAEINSHFASLEQGGRFATALIATYQSNNRKLTLTNAGHPRPLYFSAQEQRWSYLEEAIAGGAEMSNLPLGIQSGIGYQNYSIKVEAGDMLLLYTDAFVEAASQQEQLLGESGLLSVVKQTGDKEALDMIGRAIIQSVVDYTKSESFDDDATLFIVRFKEHRSVTLNSKLNGYREWVRGLVR